MAEIQLGNLETKFAEIILGIYFREKKWEKCGKNLSRIKRKSL